MRVLVHDRATGRYYRSEAYAHIFTGRDWCYLVLEPAPEGGLLKFVVDIDWPANGASFFVNVRMIVPERLTGWIYGDDAQALVERAGLRAPLKYFNGFPWLFENPDAMNRLLEGEAVAFREAFPDREPLRSELEGWTYVRSQEDAASLIQTAHEFHDSVLTGLG
jgi:hypothetical protein